MNYRMMCVVMLSGALAACQGPAGADGAAGPAGETGPQGEQGVTGDNGADGQDLAAPEAAIASVAPNALLVGRTTTLRIVGYFTEWDETTTVRLTDADNNDVEGVEIETVLVSAVGLVANVTVADSVALGALKLHVFTGETSQVYMPEGASVTVTATATSSQSELQAGETFDILLETAEYMASPTLSVENCAGVRNASIGRYSQYKFRVTGFMHPATTLGDCAMVLTQDPDTDDAWSSAVVVTITAPDVTTFTEGAATGQLTAERNFRTVAVPAGAGEVVSLRHTIDEANNLDGTGADIYVFVEGNYEPIAVYEGGDRWLEAASIEARELLVVVQDAELEEGDDPVTFNLTQITPNTTMTALQDGATQGQRLPANDAGANEAGRGSWYTITNEGPVWTTLTIAPADDTTFQSSFAVIKDDVVVDTGETTWEGVLEAGTYILAVLDDEQAEEDGVLSFGVELNRTVLLQTDENGAATGTLQTDATDSYLVTVPAGHVATFSATRDDNADINVSASWAGSNDVIAEGSGDVTVPSAEGGLLLVRLSADGDLGEGAAYSASFSTQEAAVLDFDNANEGSVPADGHAWFMGSLESAALVSLTVTPGNAEHLQTTTAIYSGTGAPLINGADTLEASVATSFFIAVGDAEFVAEQDQSFSLNVSAAPNYIADCYDESTLLEMPANQTNTWSVEGTWTNTTAIGPTSWNGAAYPMVPYALVVPQASTLDAYLEAGFDTRLVVLAGCTTTSFYSGNTVAHNDDGNDWNGNDLGLRSGVNGVALEPGVYRVGVATYSANGVAPGSEFTLNWRLRAQ